MKTQEREEAMVSDEMREEAVKIVEKIYASLDNPNFNNCVKLVLDFGLMNKRVKRLIADAHEAYQREQASIEATGVVDLRAALENVARPLGNAPALGDRGYTAEKEAAYWRDIAIHCRVIASTALRSTSTDKDVAE